MVVDRFNRNESYAQWVRRAVARGRASGSNIIALFDSSVPEPRELLGKLVTDAFAPPINARYTSAFAGGNPFVVEHLCAAYGVTADHLLCTTGATGALSLLYRALAGPGGHVLVETPGFDLFQDIARCHQIAVDTFTRTGADFAIDLDEIEARLRPDTGLIVLSNLHNPSGVVVPHATLVQLAALAERHDLRVVVDEVYGDFVDASDRPCHAASISPRFISVSSLTKTYGLSTLRCGWIVADPAVLAPVRELGERVEFGISNLAHAVAALVLDNATRFRSYSQAMLAGARPMAEKFFAGWRGLGLIEGELPRYGCIAFPRLTGIADTVAFSEWLSDRTGVIVAPGEYFGAPGHIRIGFALPPETLGDGLQMLGEGLRAFRQELQVPTAVS